MLVGAFGHNEELQVVRHEVVAFHADRCRQFSIPLLQEESFQSLEIQGAFVVRYDIQELHCLLDAVCEFHFGRDVTQPHKARFLMHHHRLLQLEHLPPRTRNARQDWRRPCFERETEVGEELGLPLLEECNKQRGCKYDCLVGLVKAAADQGHLTDLFGWLLNLRRTLRVQAESNTSCLQAEVVFLKDRAMCAQVDTLALQVRQRAFFLFTPVSEKCPRHRKSSHVAAASHLMMSCTSSAFGSVSPSASTLKRMP